MNFAVGQTNFAMISQPSTPSMGGAETAGSLAFSSGGAETAGSVASSSCGGGFSAVA